jgi:hypothetical protein
LGDPIEPPLHIEGSMLIDARRVPAAQLETIATAEIE